MLPPRPTTPDAVRRALAAPEFVLLKHSSRCPVSAAAFAQYADFHRSHPGVATAWIDVLEDRRASEEAAVVTGVAHASPQAIVVRDGRASWHASHEHVTRRAIETALGMPSG